MRGLTLVESVLGVTLMALVVLSLWQLFLGSQLTLGHSRATREASDLAQSYLETACSRPYGTYTPDADVPLDPARGTFPMQARLHVRAGPQTHLKRLAVEVTWTERNLPRSARREALVVDVAP